MRACDSRRGSASSAFALASAASQPAASETIDVDDLPDMQPDMQPAVQVKLEPGVEEADQEVEVEAEEVVMMVEYYLFQQIPGVAEIHHHQDLSNRHHRLIHQEHHF